MGAVGGWRFDAAKLIGGEVTAVSAAIFWPKEARELIAANLWRGEVCRELVTLQRGARELVGPKLRPSGEVREAAEVGGPRQAFREAHEAAKD